MPVLKVTDHNTATTTPAVWMKILQNLVDSDQEPARDRVANNLFRNYPYLNPRNDDKIEITVRMEGDDFESVVAAFNQLDDAEVLRVKSESFEDESHFRKPRTAQRKNSLPCACGCGGMTNGGRYLPGHDTRHLSSLLRAHDNGDVEATEYLIEHNHRTREQLEMRTARALDKIKRAKAREERKAEIARKKLNLSQPG